MTEAQFQRKVMKYLKDIGAFVIKYWGGGKFTKSGVPDLLCCINGKFIALELKTDKGRVTPLQYKKIDDINKSGGYARVLRPVAFDEFKQEVSKWL